MEINRENLLKMLNGLKPAIPKKGDEDMLKRVIFTGKDAVAYSESMCMVWPFVTDFRTVAPGEELIQILSKVTTETVTLIYSADCLNIKAGNVKARLKTEPDSPLLAEMDIMMTHAETDWWGLPMDFLEGIKLCMYTTSKDTTQRHLMCVHVNGEDVVSSDDFRISHYKMETPAPHEMLIPQASCLELAKYAFTTYAVSDTWLMFNTEDDIMLASRVVTESYGPVDSFFEFEGVPYTLPAKIKDHIDTVTIMAEGDQDIEKEITVTLDNGKITLSAERDIGWITAEMKDAKFVIDREAKFNISPFFFAAILARTLTMKLGTEKGLFEKGSFRHLIGLNLV